MLKKKIIISTTSTVENEVISNNTEMAPILTLNFMTKAVKINIKELKLMERNSHSTITQSSSLFANSHIHSAYFSMRSTMNR